MAPTTGKHLQGVRGKAIANQSGATPIVNVAGSAAENSPCAATGSLTGSIQDFCY
jgi:hypothetical protein